MKVKVYPTAEQAADEVAQHIAHQLTIKPTSNLGLATGSTMIPVYQKLVKLDVNFSKAITFNLDEYIGVEPHDAESFHNYMRTHLLSRLTHPPKKAHLPYGIGDEETNVLQYQQLLNVHSRDLQLLGIGTNGHIGFNEPGCDFTMGVHVERLSTSTLNANRQDLANQRPSKAITMGITDIMSAKQIVVLATGERKAQAVKQMLEGPITNKWPASILQTHPNVMVVLDEAAAKDLISAP